jgi:hypothetical protein
MQPSELAAGVVHVLFGWFKRHFSPQRTKAPDNPTSQLLPKISVEAVRRRQERQRRRRRIVGLKELFVKVFCVKKLRVKKWCVCVKSCGWKSCVLQSCVWKGCLWQSHACVWERERMSHVKEERVRESCARVYVKELCVNKLCVKDEKLVCVWCVCVPSEDM